MAVMTSRAGPNYFPILPERAEQYDPEVAAAYERNPIGAGFMSLVEHVPASVMKFERFDDYYYQPANGLPEDKRVNFQSLDMYLVPAESTRVAALRSGEVDMVPASMATKEQVEAGGGRLVFSPRASYLGGRWAGCWEPEHACYDKRVRQAFHYAIDKETIRDQLFGGPEVFEIRGWQYVSPSTSGYTPELDHWPFDPDKARQLLADAGYPGGEGFGEVIVNTAPSAAVPLLIEAAQVMADGWRRELGLDVEVRVGDSAAFTKAEIAGELKGQIRWQDNEARIDSTQYMVQTYSDPTHYSVATKDPELIQWAQEVTGIIDEGRRNEALKPLIQRLQEESYEFGFGNVSVPWGVGSRVLTWQPRPLSPHISALHTITLK
jgi:ABC-type transport system substrate-binding protein